MAQEDHHVLKSSHSGGGGGDGGGGSFSGRSKNAKQKKIPQRGLGVAQLEKIRVEEQRKKEALQAANALAKNAIETFQCPSFRQIHLPPPQSPTNRHSPNSLYRPAPSVPGIEMSSGSVQIRKQLNAGGGEIGNWPRLWNGDLEGEKQRVVDHVGFTFGSQANLPYESSPRSHPFPISSVPLRSHQFQPPSSSVVNASAGISPSSVLSSRMEPPSNQNFRSNSYASSWPEEDKMVGMKRSYPFSLETPTSPFSCNFRPTNYAASESRSDELASCSNMYTPHAEPRNKYVRESPPKQNALSKWNAVEVIKDEGKLNGDFLKLAPPSPASPPLQENCESQIRRLEPSRSMERQPFSFFPVNSDISRPSTSASSGNGGKGETLDLSLKL